MQKQALAAIATLLNSFPQRAGNPDLLLRTFEEALSGTPDEIVCEVARKFVKGEIEGQSLTFAPSVAEFTKAASRLVEIRKATTLQIERGEAVPREGISAKIERIRSQYAGRKPLAENISFEQYQQMVKAKQFPEGSFFVGALGNVYPPNPQFLDRRPA